MVLTQASKVGDAPTARQLDYLEAIARHWSDHLRSPTYRELMAELGVGSPNGISTTLVLLESKGLVVVERGSARGFRLAGIDEPVRAAIMKAQGERLAAIRALGLKPGRDD